MSWIQQQQHQDIGLEPKCQVERIVGRTQNDSATDPAVDTTVCKFKGHNRRRKDSVFEGLIVDYVGIMHLDILIQYFKDFDPVNAIGEFEEWTDYECPTSDAMSEVYNHVIRPEFNRSLLKTTDLDHTVHALFSYLLYWTDEGLIEFASLYPDFKQLALSVMVEKTRVPVYTSSAGIPFVRTSFRMLLRYFNDTDRHQGTNVVAVVERPMFCISDYVSPDLVAHFKDVYQWLMSESMTKKEVDRLESLMTSPFATIAEQFCGVGGGYRNVKQKVITGQSCCGKTTLLNELKTCGWTVCSRGDLGTFSGKSRSAPAVAGLHAAMDNALRRGDVLGDRGPIDNPLWSVIMPLCNPAHSPYVVEELMKFFNGTINEHVVAYMCQQRVVVFIDPYPSCNRARMLQRCSGGDAFRARITMYPVTQCIAYYMAARLYGWTVCCVPYDENRTFRPDRYFNIAEKIKTLFGAPIEQPKMPTPASKPDGNYLNETEYSVATGIFK